MNLQQRMTVAFPPPHRRGLYADIARLCEVSAPTVTAWFNKPEKVGTIERANAEKLCAAYGLELSPEWLAEGTGPQISHAATPASAIPYNTAKVREVPVVGKGSGGLMPERLWTDGDYPVGMTGECSEIATADPHAFLVAVEGPSMIPRYHPGEFALVEPGTTPDIEDDVLVRLATGQTILKRLLSRRAGWRFGSYNDPVVLDYAAHEVTWVYYVAHPVPRRKIKSRC